MSARAKVLALAVLVPATSLTAQDAYRYGYIRTVEPGVTLQRASEAAAEVASANMPFLPGDRVWTDGAGRMEAQFADGSVLRIDSRSKLDFVTHQGGRDERVVLRLWSGTLMLHVRDQRRSPDFTIETPEGVVEPVEPGVYRLDVAPGEARVAVLDGEASIEAGRRVRVQRGERAVVREGELYAGPDRLDGYEADDEFARWDRDLEEQLAYADGRREEWLPEEVAPYAGDFAAYGSWSPEPEYGYVWYPRVEIGWQPYSRGHWAWTVYGWTWVPNERWGWAAFHYGRWGHGNRGWYWIPGRSWGPAWVSWSVGDSHVGWCPLGWGDRPVYVRSRVQGHAVRRGTQVRNDTGITPWTYVRRADMGQRDLARRRVDAGQVRTGELRVAPAGQARLSRDLRIVEGAAGVRTGQPATGVAVPRNVLTKPTIGDTVPELQADPTTTIRRPIPRRHREPEQAEQGGTEPQGQAGTGVVVPRAPARREGSPWTAPRQQRAPEAAPVDRGQVGTGHTSGSEDSRARDVQRVRPRPDDGGATRDRDGETMRPIFGPLSRPRPDRGGSDSSGSRGGSDSSRSRGSSDSSGSRSRPNSDGGSRPAGVSNAPRSQAPPPSRPPAERARERAKPKDRD